MLGGQLHHRLRLLLLSIVMVRMVITLWDMISPVLQMLLLLLPGKRSG